MFTLSDLYSVFGGALKHPNYNETVDLAEKIAIHADGLTPKKLIETRRPSESEEVKNYRASIYEPVTRETVNRVIASIGKIRRSSDWSIQYRQEAIPSSVASSETLEMYCEKHYPLYTSVTNWMFSELVKRYLVDANSVVAVVPKSIPSNANEYIKPVIRMFDSKQVYWFEPEEFAVLLSGETVIRRTGSTTMVSKVFYVLDRMNVTRYEQSGTTDYVVAWTYEHGMGVLPAFKAKGQFMVEKNNDIVYESRISPMVPSLNEAVREYSDLQAEIVQHIHSEKYAYVSQECEHCRGIGKDSKSGARCSHCDGLGSVRSVSPYGVTLISPGMDI